MKMMINPPNTSNPQEMSSTLVESLDMINKLADRHEKSRVGWDTQGDVDALPCAFPLHTSSPPLTYTGHAASQSSVHSTMHIQTWF